MIKRHWNYKKKLCSFKTEQKKITGLFGKGDFLIIICVPSYEKRTNFAYFDNTAKSKEKVQQQ